MKSSQSFSTDKQSQEITVQVVVDNCTTHNNNNRSFTPPQSSVSVVSSPVKRSRVAATRKLQHFSQQSSIPHMEDSIASMDLYIDEPNQYRNRGVSAKDYCAPDDTSLRLEQILMSPTPQQEDRKSISLSRPPMGRTKSSESMNSNGSIDMQDMCPFQTPRKNKTTVSSSSTSATFLCSPFSSPSWNNKSLNSPALEASGRNYRETVKTSKELPDLEKKLSSGTETSKSTIEGPAAIGSCSEPKPRVSLPRPTTPIRKISPSRRDSFRNSNWLSGRTLNGKETPPRQRQEDSSSGDEDQRFNLLQTLLLQKKQQLDELQTSFPIMQQSSNPADRRRPHHHRSSSDRSINRRKQTPSRSASPRRRSIVSSASPKSIRRVVVPYHTDQPQTQRTSSSSPRRRGSDGRGASLGSKSTGHHSSSRDTRPSRLLRRAATVPSGLSSSLHPEPEPSRTWSDHPSLPAGLAVADTRKEHHSRDSNAKQRRGRRPTSSRQKESEQCQAKDENEQKDRVARPRSSRRSQEKSVSRPRSYRSKSRDPSATRTDRKSSSSRTLGNSRPSSSRRLSESPAIQSSRGSNKASRQLQKSTSPSRSRRQKDEEDYRTPSPATRKRRSTGQKEAKSSSTKPKERSSSKTSHRPSNRGKEVRSSSSRCRKIEDDENSLVRGITPVNPMRKKVSAESLKDFAHDSFSEDLMLWNPAPDYQEPVQSDDEVSLQLEDLIRASRTA